MNIVVCALLWGEQASGDFVSLFAETILHVPGCSAGARNQGRPNIEGGGGLTKTFRTSPPPPRGTGYHTAKLDADLPPLPQGTEVHHFVGTRRCDLNYIQY